VFNYALTESVKQQQKTVVNGDFGQTEQWTTTRCFRASVVAYSSDSDPALVRESGKEGTHRLYAVTARNLRRDWYFAATRFLWASSDGPQRDVRVLKPVKNLFVTGRQARGWVRILCEDVTDLSADTTPP